MNISRRFENGILVEEHINGEPIIQGGNIKRMTQRTIQPEPWPLVLLPLKAFAKPLDSGAGDIIARVIGPIGGDAFKKWYKALFKKSCGCGNSHAGRQGALNKRWPL